MQNEYLNDSDGSRDPSSLQSYGEQSKIHKWFYNHYVRPKRQYIKFTRKWSARNAFYHLNRDEVLRLAKETSGTEPGSPAFIGALQDATTALWNELSIEDQEEYQDSAREWSEKTPPKNIQSRMASSLRERIIQDFQSQLYKTCGIRSIVLTAYEGEDNDLKIGFILQDGKDFRKFCPDWKSAALWQQWAQFGMQCFAKDTVKERPKRDLSKTITTPIPLVFNADGFPELPTVVSHDGYKAKVVQTLLRDYCTAHIRYVTGIENQTIPWGSLSSDPSAWIDEECIPYDFEWKDPSKIRIDEVFRLLDHWRDRQDQGIDPLMVQHYSASAQSITGTEVGDAQEEENKARSHQSTEARLLDCKQSQVWLPTDRVPNNMNTSPHNIKETKRNGSDEESFDLHYNEDSNPQGDKTDDSLDESSVHDEPSDHSWAAESPPLHGSQDETDPGHDRAPDSPGYKSSNINRSSSSDIAGPSDTHHVQEMKELNTSPLIEKRKRFIKVSEKIKNLDTGRGAAKVHPSYLAR
ncbi:hypothetical protein H4582DRAFT_2053660 [Lactarius indigo]|nr:hypothetical protein H4582DRAFT_2053660 [Lactarius indigo]